MKIEALTPLLENNIELIEEAARDNGREEGAVVGITKQAQDRGYESLSPAQVRMFELCVRPLIEGVQCPGYTHELEDNPRECHRILDDDRLVELYTIGNTLCETCEAQASVDNHSKTSFFKD